jgi:hypothetical protein
MTCGYSLCWGRRIPSSSTLFARFAYPSPVAVLTLSAGAFASDVMEPFLHQLHLDDCWHLH